MKILEEVIKNKFKITENYKRVFDYIDTSGYSFE